MLQDATGTCCRPVGQLPRAPRASFFCSRRAWQSCSESQSGAKSAAVPAPPALPAQRGLCEQPEPHSSAEHRWHSMGCFKSRIRLRSKAHFLVVGGSSSSSRRSRSRGRSRSGVVTMIVSCGNVSASTSTTPYPTTQTRVQESRDCKLDNEFGGNNKIPSKMHVCATASSLPPPPPTHPASEIRSSSLQSRQEDVETTRSCRA